VIDVFLRFLAVLTVLFFLIRSLSVLKRRRKSLGSMVAMSCLALMQVLLFIASTLLTSPYNPLGVAIRGDNFWGILYLAVSVLVFMLGFWALEAYFEATEREAVNPIFMVMVLALAGTFLMVFLAP